MTVRWHWIAAVVLGAVIGLWLASAGESPWAVDKTDAILPTSVWWTFP